MKATLLRTILIGTALLCVGWAGTWDDLKREAASVTSVEANFVQKKYLKILNKPLVSNGRMLFKSPGSLRWEYSYPLKSVLLLHKGKARRFIEKDGQLLEDASASLEVMQVVVQQITMWLSGRFDESRVFAAHLEPGSKIVLTPRENAVGRVIEHIEIVLSDRPAVIKSVTIYESEDAYTRLDFQNIRLNTILDDTAFQFVK
jgi:outer membrane lipoprotein-sorting protein